MKRLRKYVTISCLFLLTIWNVACSDENPEIYGSLYGTVTDFKTGAPVENASVTLIPSSQVITTGKDGTFRFDNLDSRQYTISIMCRGYRANSWSGNVVSGEDVQVDISLIPINNNE